MSHTKEPWPPFTDIATMMTPDPEGTPAAIISWDDYIRARSCVNACAGISTDSLEQEGSAVMGWQRTARKLIDVTKQRDTAWAELREIREAINASNEEATVDEVCRVASQCNALHEQVECSTITRDNMEGRLNGWLVKYAAMKDDRDTWQRRAEFSYQERSELERQRDNLLAFVERVSRQKVEPYFAKEAAYVIASVKGGAA